MDKDILLADFNTIVQYRISPYFYILNEKYCGDHVPIFVKLSWISLVKPVAVITENNYTE